jgi:GT2 family glycosyltransferase
MKTNYPKDKLEIIVVDNKSTDKTVEIVKNNFNNVKLLCLDKNYGFPEGNDRGVQVAHGEYIVFLNQDVQVTKTWLRELVKSIRDNRVGAACSISLYLGNKRMVNTMGGFWSVLGISGSIGDMPYNEHEIPRNVFFPSGASMIIRKDLYRKIGGFDKDYFLYVEDADLGWRLWDAGYKVSVCSTSIVYHNIKMYGARLPEYYFFNTKNRLLTITKDATLSLVIPMLVSSLLIHMLQVVIFLTKGKVHHARETLKGIVWFFGNLDLALRKRSMTHRTGKAVRMMYGISDSIGIMLRKTAKHFT